MITEQLDIEENPSSKAEKVGDWLYEHFPNAYHIFKYRVPDFCREAKWALQRVIRKGHYSDSDLWSLDSALAKIILPKLIAFKNSNRAGYPSNFSEYDESFGGTKEEYENNPNYVGGGGERWEEILDEMIYAFEYTLYSEHFNRQGDTSKKQIEFHNKYNLKDPYRKTEDNLSYSYTYKNDKGHVVMSGDSDLENKKGYKLVEKYDSYIDIQELHRQRERAVEGFKLFGQYFQNLWD